MADILTTIHLMKCLVIKHARSAASFLPPLCLFQHYNTSATPTKELCCAFRSREWGVVDTRVNNHAAQWECSTRYVEGCSFAPPPVSRASPRTTGAHRGSWEDANVVHITSRERETLDTAKAQSRPNWLLVPAGTPNTHTDTTHTDIHKKQRKKRDRNHIESVTKRLGQRLLVD